MNSRMTPPRIPVKFLLIGLLALATRSPAADAPASNALLALASHSQATEPASPEGYELHPGDVLQVVVWKEPDLQAEVLIRPDGGMTFPLAGELHAAGRTVEDVAKTLQQRIRRYVPEAVVTVAVKAVAGSQVFVIGKVNHPGQFPLNGPLDVMQALSLAGGSTSFADTNGIRILRRSEGRQTSIPFRYGDVERGHNLEQNILLQSGDTVVVP
jgi:polysaccharide export outer membrane protein